MFCVLVSCCVLMALPMGCSKSDPINPLNNIPPETYLSFAPDAGDTVCYRVRMNWFGWDPDGEVTHFLTMWDSLGWVHTVVTDSVFSVSTDDTTGGPDQSYGYHTFSVKSVDDAGDEDPTPASVSFTAENIFPDTEIISGPAGIVGPFVTFEFVGSDSDGEIAGFGYQLLIREGDDYVEYVSADGLGPHETVAEFGPLFGAFKFRVWAIDGQGARDVTPAERWFYATCMGPSQLRVTSNVFNGFSRWPVYPDPWGARFPPIFEGEHVTFDWSAEGYGIKYRYAYDDTLNWSAWSATGTHFEVTPAVGQHEVHIAIKDTLQNQVHVYQTFEVIETGLDDYILIVDDYNARETHESWGTDVQRDAFYDALVAPFGERYAWDPAEHVFEGNPLPPDVQTLSGASTVVWYCDYSEEATIGPLFDPFLWQYDLLGGYVRVGGNLVLCGWATLTQVAREDYPFSMGPEDSTPGRTFIRDILRIGSVDNSGHSADPAAPWDYGFCLHGAVPTSEGDAYGFAPAYIDTGLCPDAPGKWFMFCEPEGSNYHRCGMNVENVYPYEGESIELLVVDSFINMSYDGETCAVLYLSGTDRGNVCYLGFPLYYMQTPHAEALLSRVLSLFGEEER